MIDHEVHIGFLDVLALLFVMLKLIGVIDWSWWRVLVPVWVQLGTILFFWLIQKIIR